MKVLVVSPHPDDEAIGCGGTICKHVAENDSVSVLFLTSGERGGHGLSTDTTMKLREAEAEQAATILGIKDIRFWRKNDGALRATRQLIEQLVKYLKEHAPDLIYVPNEFELHSDHRAAARLVRAACRQSDKSIKVLSFEVWTPLTALDEIVDITPYIDMKLAAVQAYKSQCNVLRFDEAMLGLARFRGEMFCWPKVPEGTGGKFAEVFQELPQ